MTRNRTVGRAGKSLVAGLVFALGLWAVPEKALADAESTWTETVFNFNSICAGEVISLTGRVHTVQRDNSPRGAPEHGNWASAEGIGLTTGSVYRITGSPTNYQVGPDEFMNHVTLVGSGVTFTLTRLHGTSFFGSYEVIQEHCN